MRKAVREDTLTAARQLLSYYRLPEVALPRDSEDEEALAGYLNGNTPLILVPIVLEEDWYRCLSCPLLTWDAEGICRAVFPGRLGGAWFRGGGSGRRTAVNRENQGQFRRESYAVQQDLAGQTPTVKEAVRSLLRGMGGAEAGLFLLWSLLGGVFLVLLGALLRSMMTDAVLRAELSAVGNYVLCSAGLTAVGLVMLYIGRQMLCRMSRRGALRILPALGERLWMALDHREFAAQAALLAGACRDGETVCSWLLTVLWGAGMLLPAELVLWGVSPRMAGASLLTALLLTLAGCLAVRTGRGQRNRETEQAREQYRWLEGRSADKRFGVRRPFPYGQKADRKENDWLGWAIPLLLTPALAAGAGARLVLTDLLYGMALAVPAVTAPAILLYRGPETGRALARLKALLAQAERHRGCEQDLPDMDSPLELKTVTFTYPDSREPVLRDVELLLTPGEVLGILGPTGSGKTTLARLMTGLLTPDSGMVYYGGTELRRYEPERVRERIALDRGTDILLLDHPPETLDRRTTVIFSTRAEDLRRCGRVCELRDGRLLERRMERKTERSKGDLTIT